MKRDERDEPSMRFATEKSVQAGLEAIRLRRRWAWLLLLAAFPGVALATLTGRLFPVLAAVWIGAVVVAAWRSSRSRCPRCGEDFHFHFGVVGQFFTRRCVRCGLHLNADRRQTALR